MKKLLTILLLCFYICQPAAGTISNQTARETLATGDGSTTAFTFSFPIDTGSAGSHPDLEVWLRTTATGAQTQQTETTHYSVAATNNNFTSGGTVTMVTAPAATQKLLLLRSTPQTQSSDIGASGVLLTLENALDKVTKQMIDMQEEVDRSIKIPKTDVTTLETTLPNSVDRASTNVTMDSDGGVTATEAVSGISNVSSFGATLIDDASALVARGTLGMDTDDNVEFAEGVFTNIKTKGPVFDVTAYGATGDGATDDTTNVQSALTAAGSAGGGVVLFPGGTYLLTSPLTISSGTILRGVGVDSVIKTATASTDLIDITGTKSGSVTDTMTSDAAKNQADTVMTSDTGVTGFAAGDVVYIEADDTSAVAAVELNIVASETGSTLTMEADLYDNYNTADSATVSKLTVKENIIIEKLKFENTGSGTGQGIDIDYAMNVIVRDCYFTQCDENSVQYSKNVHFLNNTFYDNEDSVIKFSYSKYCSAIGNNVRKTAQTGILLKNFADSCIVADNYIKDTTGVPIQNVGCDNSIIKGNQIYDTASDGINVDTVGAATTAVNIGVQITGNHIRNCGDVGVPLTSSDNVLFADNIIEETTSVGMNLEIVNYSIVNNNIFRNIGSTTAHDGININPTGTATSSYNTISGNIFYDCGGYAIDFNPAATASAHYNVFVGNVAEPLTTYGIGIAGGTLCQYNKLMGNTMNILSSQSKIVNNEATTIGDGQSESVSVDLSGSAIVVPVFHSEVAVSILSITFLYTEASDANTGIALKVGIEANDDFFLGNAVAYTSEASKAIYYTKNYVNTAFESNAKILPAGNTVIFTSAGGKTGPGEVRCIVNFCYI